MYKEINKRLEQIGRQIERGEAVDFSTLIELSLTIASYRKALCEEMIQISMLQDGINSLLPPTHRPVCIPTRLSEKQLNEVYDRLVELDFIEGGDDSKENFLSVFDPTTPAPSPLIKWKKTGRNKELDIVSMLNFILLVGGRENDLEEYSKSFFGVSFSKATRSRAGIQTDLRKLGMLLGISSE